VIKAGSPLVRLTNPNVEQALNIKYLELILYLIPANRSALRDEVDKTTYGAFIDIDPQRENISLRSLVS
jgi:hypothetical protein